MIDTTEDAAGLDDAIDGDIDDALGGSADFKKAVEERKKIGNNVNRLQAEPSHFHLAQIENERRLRPLKKLSEQK